MCTLTGYLLSGLVGRVRGRSVYSDRRPAFGSRRQSDWSDYYDYSGEIDYNSKKRKRYRKKKKKNFKGKKICYITMTVV